MIPSLIQWRVFFLHCRCKNNLNKQLERTMGTSCSKTCFNDCCAAIDAACVDTAFAKSVEMQPSCQKGMKELFAHVVKTTYGEFEAMHKKKPEDYWMVPITDSMLQRFHVDRVSWNAWAHSKCSTFNSDVSNNVMLKATIWPTSLMMIWVPKKYEPTTP